MTASARPNPTFPLALQRSVKGRVISPDDSEYEEARPVFYGNFDRRPAAIVKVADETEVATVVNLARDTGTELAIRSGGHSLAGHGTTNGGIVLDLADMQDLQVDVKSRTAWAQTGLTTGQYTAATADYGLATGFGDTASVGIGGITLAGGIGFLVRKHGLAIDDLLAAEIVTADGDFVHADEETHPDLFWAIRGGGGNFGVATRLKFRLHEINQIVGGLLVLPASPESIASFIAVAESASNDVSTILGIMPAPPLPFIPSEYHGQLVLMAQIAHAGSSQDGERAMESFRAIAPPVVDMLGPMPYPEIIQTSPVEHPIAAVRNLFVDTFDTAAVGSIVDHLAEGGPLMSVVQVRVLGGAMADVAVDATAFAHRQRRLMVVATAIVQHSEDIAVNQARVDELAAALGRGNEGAYPGFLGTDGHQRVREAYPGAIWDRLQRVKAKYDPTNLFRHNHNIPPSKDDT
jgi:FAD/FMN-containing dehydrogenase